MYTDQKQPVSIKGLSLGLIIKSHENNHLISESELHLGRAQASSTWAQLCCREFVSACQWRRKLGRCTIHMTFDLLLCVNRNVGSISSEMKLSWSSYGSSIIVEKFHGCTTSYATVFTSDRKVPLSNSLFWCYSVAMPTKVYTPYWIEHGDR